MKNSLLPLLALCFCLACQQQAQQTSNTAAATVNAPTTSAAINTAMTQAAKNFLNSLDDELKTAASLPYDHEDREQWDFVPLDNRRGARISLMNEQQQRLAYELLQTGLSEKGYRLARDIMELESVLQIIEKQKADSDYRQPEKYFISIFGTPDPIEPWAWSYEGHHLSLNYSSVDGKVAVTPAFVGSNPAEIRIDPGRGRRVLGDREDAGRVFMLSLNEKQQQTALISEEAYPEIVTGTESFAKLENFEGLSFSAMDAAQQEALVDLLKLHMNIAKKDVMDQYWKKIEKEGLENIFFAWAGGLKKNQKHYYRIHTPSTIIEYDNAQNSGNHAHIVWRDLDNDFARDWLKEHHEKHAH
ncbi:MAG: DUF3500 domain-containing protein [Bacteroidota bacterium]